MKKRFLPLLLSLGLILSALPAGAAQAAESNLFPAVNTYPGYADVKEEDWFYDNAKLCYEIGLMTGTDRGFEPNKTLTVAECAVLAARLLEGLTGRPIPAPVPDPSLPWYQHYMDYLSDFVGESGSSLYGVIPWDDRAEFERPATRYDFLVFMALVADGDRGNYFPAINSITYEQIPDVTDDNVVLRFYNIGILTGKDKYGTFDRSGTLTRAEGAAMVTRMARPELRKAFRLRDHTPFNAAHLTPDTVMFQSTPPVTAEHFLAAVNEGITRLEETARLDGVEFNWHNDLPGTGKTYLEWLKAEVLYNRCVTESQATEAYRNFDYQVYYSRLIDLRGGPLERADRPEPAKMALRDYTLTEITLPEGWEPTIDTNNIAAGWIVVNRKENGYAVDHAIYRAADGALLDLGDYYVFSGNAPKRRGDETRALVTTSLPEDRLAWNVYDVELGKLLLDAPIPDGSGLFEEQLDPLLTPEPVPQPIQDEATGLYGYRDEAGIWRIPAKYSALWYTGDGLFTYWGDDWQSDCGLVSLDGVETPTKTFSGYFNGGLSANYGLIAMHSQKGWRHVDTYYDYAGNQASEDFDWAGPIGDDGAGFVCRDGKLYRIQF